MKKISVTFIIILIVIISLGIFVSCNKDEDNKLSGVPPTNECRVKDFQQLNAVFPHKLFLPENCGDEDITVRFSGTNNSEYWEELIRKNEKIDLLIGGVWSKKYTDYTINVQFDYQENFQMPEEFLQTLKDEVIVINGCNVYQEKTNLFIFVEDKNNDIIYFVGISEIVDLTLEERDAIIKNYFNIMCRVNA